MFPPVYDEVNIREAVNVERDYFLVIIITKIVGGPSLYEQKQLGV